MTDQNQQSLLLGKIAAYTEILVKDPNSTIFVSLAETYRKMGMFEDSRQIISKGLELHPDFSPAHIVLARILCQLEDLGGSVAAFDRALELDEENLAALVGYARVQILLGEAMVARDLLLKARQLSPADPVINKLLLSLPDVIDAVVESSSEVETQSIEPVNSPKVLVSSTLAELYMVQGLTEKALDLFQRLSTQNPDDLTLRRRVKELEGQLRADNQNVEISDPECPAPHEQEVEPYLLASENEEHVCEPVVETLTRWLTNIQQRRGNV